MQEGAMRLDIHAHYFPNEYLDLLERFGRAAARGSRGLLAGKDPADLEARFQMMERAGVDRQVLSVGPLVPAFEDAGQAMAAARLANDLYAEIVSLHPNRFLAFAAVPLPHVEIALAELRRGLDELQMVGVTSTTSILGRSLADPAFEPFFAELDRRGAVLFLHPAGAGFGEQTNLFGLTWIVGAPFEDTAAALHLILSGLSTRYPNVRVIVPHLGGTLPFLLARVDSLWTPGGSSTIQEAPSTLARRLWYDTVSHGSGAALRCACDVLGAGRLVLGSDYPYLQWEKYQRAVTYIQDSGLPPADAEAILNRNAAALVHREA
jgi:predicted TIM-barrel fold metal-dependent hydrolase